MRLVITKCAVDYAGRLDAHLEPAIRLIMVKADGSVLVHADGGSYKPLNWMSAPCDLHTREATAEEATAGITEVWEVVHRKTEDKLKSQVFSVYSDIE